MSRYFWRHRLFDGFVIAIETLFRFYWIGVLDVLWRGIRHLVMEIALLFLRAEILIAQGIDFLLPDAHLREVNTRQAWNKSHSLRFILKVACAPPIVSSDPLTCQVDHETPHYRCFNGCVPA